MQRKNERIYVYLCSTLKDSIKIFKKQHHMNWDQVIFHLSNTIEPPDKYQNDYKTNFRGERNKLLNIYITPLTLTRFNKINAFFEKQADCIDYLMKKESEKPLIPPSLNT